MKKLLRRWLSIDEIIFKQDDLEDAMRHREEFYDNLAKCINKLLFMKLDEKFEKLEDNTIRLNAMMLELKGVVAMARATVDQGKSKSK